MNFKIKTYALSENAPLGEKIYFCLNKVDQFNCKTIIINKCQISILFLAKY